MKELIILIISFILEGIVSVYLPIINPLFTLVGLLYLSLFSKYKKKDILIITGIVGFIYDILYMNTLIINMLLIIMITYFIIRIDYQHNLKNFIIITIISTIFYLLGFYLFTLVNNNTYFSMITLFKSLYKAILINVLYALILILIFNRSKQRKIHIYYYR